MKYETMTIDEIIAWCKANDQVAWLKAEAQKKVDYKVYPKVSVVKDGKTVKVVDRKQEPTIIKKPISFIQLKLNFVETFMPDLAPEKKPKKPTMYERIANL